MIAQFLTTMLDDTDGCAKQYHCASYVYLLSCLALEFSTIIDKEVGAPGYGKYVVDSINDGDKWMLNLAMENKFNPKLILD